MKHIHFNTINSTNQYLKDNYESLDNLTIISADHQTNGRGRFNRKWFDSDDLLFSILLKENIENPADYSLVIAKTVFTVLNKYMTNVSIKWPNDILVNDNKVCGILLEAVTTSKLECVIIGVGINVNTSEFSDDLKIKATSLSKELNKTIDKEELFNKIINSFEEDYKEYVNGNKEYLEIINDNFYLKNKNVMFTYNNQVLNGTALGINNNGEILIKVNDEIVEISTGEVTFTNVYNS